MPAGVDLGLLVTLIGTIIERDVTSAPVTAIRLGGCGLDVGRGHEWRRRRMSAARRKSVFYPNDVIGKARTGAAGSAWASRTWQEIIERAEPWLQFSDDELWGMVFGPSIKRSWMVWSDGHCPACQAPVVMYNWLVDALAHPWKVCCPRCGEFFPKNDFKAVIPVTRCY